jgi:glycosyltransferase involved in cell wall biosynthesis
MYPSAKKPFFGTFVKEQVRCLEALGYNIRVIGDKGEGSSVIQVGKKYLSLMLRSLLATIITKPDIIHAHYIFPPGFIGWICSILSRSPLLLTSHRGDVFDMPYLNRLFFRLTKFCLKKAKRIIAVSTEIRDKIVFDFKIDAEKIHVLNMGVRVSRAVHSKNTEKGIDTRKKVKVIFIGISFERKGGYVLIKAAEEVNRRLPDRVFYEFIGQRPPKVEHLIERKGLRKNVSFKGILTNKETLTRLKGADIFVLPSFSEGLPIAMLEAMSNGLGVIVSPVGDVPSVIQDKQNGLLVPIGDQCALAEAIFKLATDTEFLKRLGCKAKKTAYNHSSDKKATELSAIYRECFSKF